MNNLTILLAGLFSHELLQCSEIPSPTNMVSPRSPRLRKTKSPGGAFECSSPWGSSSFSSPQEDNPNKRAKMVTINSSDQIWNFYRESSEIDLNNENSSDEIDLKDAEVEEIFEPGYDIITEKDLEVDKPTSSAASKPILKMPKFTRQPQADLMSFFETASVKDVVKFYLSGTQLVSSPALHRMFKAIFRSQQYEKIQMLYKYDKFAILDFVLKSRGENQIRTQDVIELADLIFNNSGEDDMVSNLKAISAITKDSFACRAQFFLYAVDYAVNQVYTAVNDLLEDESTQRDYSKLSREIIQRFYEHTKCPLVLSVIEKDSGFSIMPILNFDPEECSRVDREGRSIFYHAAAEGLERLQEIEFLNEKYSEKQIAGTSPLIGAALKGREDSIEYFLGTCKDKFRFSKEDIEDAALASASSGNISVLRMLRKYSDLDLYCHRGSDTLLSVSLKNNQIGYATALLRNFGYNVNFVGQDPINPGGNSLIYLLDKYQTAEFFLQKGANRNVRIPIKQPDETVEYVHLDQYLEISTDQKLIKIFKGQVKK